jgi:hypothetical protein
MQNPIIKIIRLTKLWRRRLAGHATSMEEKVNAYSVLVRRPEGKGPLGRRGHKWVDNIKMDPRNFGYGFIWLRIRSSVELL